jgi:hypothetical protein
MSKAFTQKVLDECIHKLAYGPVRTQLNKQKTLITFDLLSLERAFTNTYNLMVINNPETEYPDLTFSDIFNRSAEEALQLVKESAENPRKKSVTATYSTLNTPTIITVLVNNSNTQLVKDIKKVFTNNITKELKSTLGRGLTTARDVRTPGMSWQAAAKRSEVGQLNKGIEMLHSGKSTVGIAQLQKALSLVSKASDGDMSFDGFLSEDNAKNLHDVFGHIDAVITYNSDLDNFSLQEGANIEIRIDSYTENFGGSEPHDWKVLKPKLVKEVTEWAKGQDWWNMPGSNSLKKDGLNGIAYSIQETLTKSKNVTATKKVKKPKRNKKPVRTKSKNAGTRYKGSNKQPVQRPAQKTSPSSTLNISMILGILNQRLPQTVAANMGSPALNYRSGRFASSVRVVDVQKTPQGFNSFGYTYMKSPYQTFEPGFAQGDPDRDPRTLINESIREIAAELAIGRFYTRRL